MIMAELVDALVDSKDVGIVSGRQAISTTKFARGSTTAQPASYSRGMREKGGNGETNARHEWGRGQHETNKH